MTRVRAGVLALILAGHAGLYFWHWYLPNKASPVATAPLSVTIALVRPTPTVRAAARRLSADRAPTRQTQASPIAPPEEGKVAAKESPDAMPAPAPAAPLQLNLPRDNRITAISNSPARMALEDPRSNTAKPRLSERFSITLGSYECVFTERMPDGSIYRGPGVWDSVPNSDVTATGGILDPRGPAKVCRRKPV